MVWSSLSLNRVLTLLVLVVMGLSTGVAAGYVPSGSLEAEVVAGHTTYVKHVRTMSQNGLPAVAPLSYGLATHRESAVFGLFDRVWPVDPSDDKTVFAWRGGTPDPREAVVLEATGERAEVRDAFGRQWTVQEYRYGDDADQDGAPDHLAYGVAVDQRHSVVGPDLPHGLSDRQYNYVITYRVDRLFSEFAPGGAFRANYLPEERAAPVDGVPHGVQIVDGNGAVADPGDVPLVRSAQGIVRFDGEPLRIRLEVRFGIGDTPPIEGADLTPTSDLDFHDYAALPVEETPQRQVELRRGEP